MATWPIAASLRKNRPLLGVPLSRRLPGAALMIESWDVETTNIAYVKTTEEDQATGDVATMFSELERVARDTGEVRKNDLVGLRAWPFG